MRLLGRVWRATRRRLLPLRGKGAAIPDTALSTDAAATEDAAELVPTYDLGDLPTGTYPVTSVPPEALIGIPPLQDGAIEVIRWGDVGSFARLTTESPTARDFRSLRVAGRWAGWVEDRPVSEGGRRLPSATGPLKTTPLALTTGYGGGRATGSGTTTVVQHLHRDVRRFQLRLRNWNPRFTYADRPPAALENVRVGRHLGRGHGTDWIDLPEGSTEYRSGWLDVPASLRGAEILVQYSWSGRDVMRCLGTGWTDGARDKFPPLFAWLELKVPTSVPVVAVIGSSTAAGVGSARPLVDAWLHRWARAQGAIPAFWTASGDSAATWTTEAQRKWEPYGTSIAAPDILLQALGANDWASGASLESLQERLARATVEARARLSGTVIGTTITPRRAHSERDSVRHALNEWMSANGLFDEVLDLAAAVSSPDGRLDPKMDADGTHVNDLGHERIAATLSASTLGSRLAR